MGDLDVDGRVILIEILDQSCARVWIGWKWLGVTYSDTIQDNVSRMR
jgi:hypothetical protein